MDINAIETKVVSFLVDKGFDIIGAIIILVIGAFSRAGWASLSTSGSKNTAWSRPLTS